MTSGISYTPPQNITQHDSLNIFPDGGVARLRARGVVKLDSNEGKSDDCIDLAAALNGGVAIGASNAHYGRAR